MVYESDFYTTRRPYRTTPSYSTYTTSSFPSRQVRILPGLGKVHIVHTYDRIVPYVGHKRLTVVTTPRVYSTRPSILQREYDWIESKVRPWVSYSATNNYLNSNSAVRIVYRRSPYTSSTSTLIRSDHSRPYWLSDLLKDPYTPWEYKSYWPEYKYLRPYLNYWPLFTHLKYSLRYRPHYALDSWYYNSKPIRSYTYDDLYRSLSYYCPTRFYPRIFDDETRLIRAKTASLLKQIHAPVPRNRVWPITALSRYSETPARLSNDYYIHKLLSVSPRKAEYTTYFTDPIRKYIGQGHLACVSYVGDRAHGRRRNVYVYEDPVKNDIQLLSYYINKIKQDKLQQRELTKVPLAASRPSRKFSAQKHAEDNTSEELKQLREARAARLAKIHDDDSPSVEVTVKAKKQQEESRLAEEKELVEQQEKEKARAKKDEAARKKELARQEALAAERAAELERQAELIRQEELAKQAAIDKARQEEEQRKRIEEERRLEEEVKAEEERKQLLRLEEIARQAEDEREAELARQADELAELARQEAELAEQAKKEAEIAELARQESELAELQRQEEELAELERQEKELAELAEKAKEESEAAKREAKLAELEEQEAELAELERQQAELDALEEEAKTLEGNVAEDTPSEHEPVVEELNEDDVQEEPIEDPVEVEELEEPEAEAENLAATNDDTDEEAEDEELGG